MPPEQDQETTSMRDDFEAVIDQMENEQEYTTSEVQDENTRDTPQDDNTDFSDDESTEEQQDVEQAVETDKSSDATERTESEDGQAATQKGDETADDTRAGAKSKDSIKAPIGWAPKARQNWSKLPREVQEQVVEREKNMAEAMANTKQARATQQQFDQLSQSFAPILAAEGVDAMAATQSLFKTAAELRLGTNAQKAQVIAELIEHYGVDIPTLDQTLSGGQVAPSEDEKLEQMFNKRFGPMADAFKQMQHGQQQQTHQSAQAEVQEFAKTAEFINDVRHDMADIIDMKKARGVDISLKEAYDIACRMNPEVSDIMRQRENDARIDEQNKQLESKKKASSPLIGRKTGVAPKNSENQTMRETLSEAWENQNT